MSINITLIRHAKTLGNLDGCYIGKTDEPLCELGITQLNNHISLGLYRDTEFLYSSKMLRCIQTANIIYPSITTTIINGLEECDFGDFEGKNYTALNLNPAYQKWIDSMGKEPFPNGESHDAFKRRCTDAFLKICRNHSENSTVTIICHGGTIMSILEKFTIPPPLTEASHEPQDNFYKWQIKNTHGFSFAFDAATQTCFDIQKN